MTLKNLPLTIWAILVGGTALAQPAPVPSTAPTMAPRDDALILRPQPQLQQRPEIGSPSTADAGKTSGQELPSLSDDDLRQNRPLAEHVINQAMLTEDWATLEHVMEFYPQMEGADPMLVDYVLGALARRAGRHGEAIERYRRMLSEDSTLTYVRLDLAGMLFEDKQYKDSQQELDAVLSDMRLAPAARASAQQYQQALAKAQGWSGSVALGWGWNSNVNQGADNRSFFLYTDIDDDYMARIEFLKPTKDYPHSAQGPRYEASASRDFNLTGHHYLTLGGNVDGKNYIGYSDYNQVSAGIRAGYKWQNLNSWLNVTPIANRMWQGGHGYSQGAGGSIDYGRWLHGNWQVSASLMWLSRHYDSKEYLNYEGHLRGATFGLINFLSPNLAIFGNLSLQDEDVRDGENSSIRRTAQLGVFKSFDNGLSTRTSARYTHRKFDEPYSLFLWRKRRDREYQFDASIWKNNFQLAGFTPKLNVSYLRVKSTLYAYPRTEKEVWLMLEKTF